MERRNKVLGCVSASFLFVSFFLCFIWVVSFDVVYTDSDGKPVVCDVRGIHRTIDAPECREALQGPWKRENPLIWKGSCDPKTRVCIPDRR